MNYKQDLLNRLTGHGIEIGALHERATTPTHCKVDYCDAITKEEAIRLFPEIDHSKLLDPDIISDIDMGGLSKIESEKYDFVIFSHVIEHVANPIQALQDLMRILKAGGLFYLACPDKDYTYDKKRNITSWDHLKAEFETNTNFITDEHYLDFLRGVHPEVFTATAEALQQALESVRRRREHAHVWDSKAFDEFLKNALNMLNVKTKNIQKYDGNQTAFEYLILFEKLA